MISQDAQQEQFYDELVKVINRFTDEYDLTVPSVIGVLEVIKTEIMLDALDPTEGD